MLSVWRQIPTAACKMWFIPVTPAERVCGAASAYALFLQLLFILARKYLMSRVGFCRVQEHGVRWHHSTSLFLGTDWLQQIEMVHSVTSVSAAHVCVCMCTLVCGWGGWQSSEMWRTWMDDLEHRCNVLFWEGNFIFSQVAHGSAGLN